MPKKVVDTFLEIIGSLGFIIVTAVAVYLILNIFGVLKSPAIEEVLLVAILGQTFYNGYAIATMKAHDKRLGNIEKKIGIAE